MQENKPNPGQPFPDITVPKLGGGELKLSPASREYDWLLIVVYRGKHCPICTNYLNELNELLPRFRQAGVDVVAISADSEQQAEEQIQLVKPDFDVGYGLSIEQMQTLGLYLSNPRSEAETDHVFSEPGLFVVNSENKLQVLDISNAPFARPGLASMIMGLNFIRNPENNYPIRGTY